MNARLIGGLVTLGLGIAAAGAYLVLSGNAPSFSATAGACQTNASIPADTRRTISEAATAIVDMFANRPKDALAQMSTRGRREAEQQGTIESASARYAQSKSSSPAHVSDIFLMNNTGSETVILAPCPAPRGGGVVMVGHGSTPRSALVLVDQDVQGDSRKTLQILLEDEGGAWRARGIFFSFTRLNGQDSNTLWDNAKAQQAKGNSFNAYMLFVGAAQSLIQGPLYFDPKAQDRQKEFAAITPPPIMQGRPPLSWALGGETFQINFVQSRGLEDGRIQLHIFHAVPNATTFELADVANRSLIEKFDAAYPEWRDVYQLLAAQTDVSGKDAAWTTVYSPESGFLAPTNPAPYDPQAAP